MSAFVGYHNFHILTDYGLLRDMLNSTYNILPLSGLATLTGQRTLTVFEEPVSGKLEQFVSNTFLNHQFIISNVTPLLVIYSTSAFRTGTDHHMPVFICLLPTFNFQLP